MPLVEIEKNVRSWPSKSYVHLPFLSEKWRNTGQAPVRPGPPKRPTIRNPRSGAKTTESLEANLWKLSKVLDLLPLNRRTPKSMFGSGDREWDREWEWPRWLVGTKKCVWTKASVDQSYTVCGWWVCCSFSFPLGGQNTRECSVNGCSLCFLTRKSFGVLNAHPMKRIKKLETSQTSCSNFSSPL